MKIERLNENQIRCILNKADFEKRKLGLAELVFGSEKAKDLFQDMMQQAYSELGFEVDNIPLMIEAIPVSLDCLILVITKVEDPEELEARMPDVSNILRIGDDDLDDEMDDYDDEYDDEEDTDEEIISFSSDDSSDGDLDILSIHTEDMDETSKAFLEEAMQEEMEAELEQIPDNAPDLLGMFRQHLEKAKAAFEAKNAQASDPVTPSAASKEKKSKKEKPTPPESLIYQFENLDSVITLSGLLAPFYEGESMLYKDEMDGFFYLVLTKGISSMEDHDRACTIASDYGYTIVDSYGTPAYFCEHFTPVFEEDALYYLNQLNE